MKERKLCCYENFSSNCLNASHRHPSPLHPAGRIPSPNPHFPSCIHQKSNSETLQKNCWFLFRFMVFVFVYVWLNNFGLVFLLTSVSLGRVDSIPHHIGRYHYVLRLLSCTEHWTVPWTLRRSRIRVRKGRDEMSESRAVEEEEEEEKVEYPV